MSWGKEVKRIPKKKKRLVLPSSINLDEIQIGNKIYVLGKDGKLKPKEPQK